MNNQSVMSKNEAPGLPVPLGVGDALNISEFQPSGAMIARAAQFGTGLRNGVPDLVAAEHVGSFIVSVPRSSARQRGALITYAVEDRIATSIDSVEVVQAPLTGAANGEVLALVIARDVMAKLGSGDAPVLPEFLLIPRPVSEDGPSWSVWRDGERVVVRCADGTGFAAGASVLSLLWHKAGCPTLFSLGEKLDAGMSARDLSAAPPPPDPGDLAFSLARGRPSRTGGFTPWRLAASVAGVALALHVGLGALDAAALRSLADTERAKAERAISDRLPGVALTGDVSPILARLAPVPAPDTRARFLPLLGDVTAVMGQAATRVSFRRLAWGADDNSLVILVQSGGLDDLQRVQQALIAAGFAVRSGAANAGDGGAEVELRITRGDRG